MSLSTLPLPSIALVLTSNMLDIPTRPSLVNCDQDPFPDPKIGPGHGTDRRDLETLEYHCLSFVLRGHLPLSDASKQKRRRWSVRIFGTAPTFEATPFSKLLRRIVPTHVGQQLGKRNQN